MPETDPAADSMRRLLEEGPPPTEAPAIPGPVRRRRPRRPTLVAVALILAVGLGLHARREYYRRLVLGHRAFVAAELARMPRLRGAGLARGEWVEEQRALTREYQRIADFPWLPFRTPPAR